MQFEGGCYCGGLRYSAQGAPRLRAQCHCRECQYFSGGGPNFYMLMKPDGFLYTKGEPAMAIYTIDRQPFHTIPEGLPIFERLPPY